MVKIGVVRFPGTNNEWETLRALRSFGVDAELVEEHEVDKIGDIDGVWFAGGFSYGDVLRAGAIASSSEITHRVKESGLPAFGACNGFQILCESGMLDGVLLPNTSTRFVCRWIHLKISENTSFLNELSGSVLRLPIAHFEGNYISPDGSGHARAVAFYSSENGNVHPSYNPNGSQDSIAGVSSSDGRIVGMMPHPERASFKHQGSLDGRKIISAFISEVRQ